MQVEKKVVASIDGSPMVVDLEDFPHGDLAFVKKDSGYDIEFYNVPDGIEVASYDETTGTPEFRQVKYWSVHKGKPVEIVNLDDGRQIITDNDPRAVYGISKHSESLVPGRFTPSQAMDEHVMVPVVSEELARPVDGMFYSFRTGLIGEREDDACTPLGFDFGQFVGVMAGDGWADVDYNPYLSDNEGFNIDFVSGFLKSGPFPGFRTSKTEHKASEEPGRYGDTKAFRLNCGSSMLGRRIKELVDGHGDEKTSGSANKRLPVWYQFAGRDFICGVVNGLMATDGTVAVSHGKAKPQLQMSFSSTSLRLAREFRRCCQLLGVGACVSFSKNTSGGNTSWMCTVSTVDAKKVGLLSNCCNTRKRGIFESMEVSVEAVSTRKDLIPFPKGISTEIVSLVPAPDVHSQDGGLMGVEWKKKCISAAINARRRAGEGAVTRSLVEQIRAIGDDIAEANAKAVSEAEAEISRLESLFSELLASDNGGSRRTWKVSTVSESARILVRGWLSARSKSSPCPKECLAKFRAAMDSIRSRGCISWSVLAFVKDAFAKYGKPNTELRDSKALAELLRLSKCNVKWTGIKSVEKTGKVEAGYDLTVPGPDTFLSDDGVVLSNTVSIHVPSSEKAAKQALEKMLPSKNLFSLTDMKSMRYRPEKEQISGLWALTRGATRKPTRYFSSKAEAIAAYRNGEIGPNDPIEIKEG